MRFLLTGATGFLGSYLCKALVERGHAVEAFRRPSSNPWRLGDLAAELRWHELPQGFDAAFSGPQSPQAVIHCAAIYGRRGEALSELVETNTRLPVRLYEMAAARGVPAFVNTGTILEPGVSPYALSKHHAVEWLRLAPGSTRVLNLKVQHFFGPGDDPTKFITWLIRQTLSGVPEIPLTDGQQWRDFVYVSDVVSAMVTLVENLGAAAPVERFMEYEIGSGESVQLRDLVGKIHRLTGSRSRLAFGAVPYRAGEPTRTEANISAMRGLGWQPQVTLDEGLARTVQAERMQSKSA